MTNTPEIRWIQAGIAGGLCASVFYPVLLFVPAPAVTILAAALLGPSIGIGSLGLRQLVVLRTPSVTANLAAASNLLAGTLFTAMVMVQLAVRMSVPDTGSVAHEMVGIWLGLDVAWDVYIGLGTLLFCVPMFRHERFRWPFALPGLVLGLLVLILNLYTFPTPPAEAGLFDVGPLVGLWYLAATIQAWRSLGWARRELALLD